MPNRLIIVESPSKARTLGRFLGAGYTIKASMGHVRDLPKKGLAVDIDNAFRPEYEVTKETQVRDLRKAAKAADSVLLASDPDREGEAIAWHLAEELHLKNPERIVFHEITKAAVEAALASPRPIDRHLVAAQEARRVIDRLVGYQISPLLWKKVSGGGRRRLSAGRVQSVAVRLVVDREREIDAFVTEESWTVDALLVTDGGEELTARLYARRGEVADDEPSTDASAEAEPTATEAGARDGTRLVLTDEASALAVMTALGVDADGKPAAGAPPFRVAGIIAKSRRTQAPAPYTTSSLQQDASTRLRMAPGRTMRIAQQLYEGIDLGSEGSTGLITYMRTDSSRISPMAKEAAARHIEAEYGASYVGKGGPARGAKKGPVDAQDAHEGIRPTDVTRTPDAIAGKLTDDQRKVYDLVWRRFVASQMAPALFDTTRVDLEAGDFVFRASGSVLRFDGWLRVARRDDDRSDRNLPALTENQELALRELKREQHFTQPPPRFTEASLIKELEERGIGRPSTYASIVDTIQEREYVAQQERRLHPTALGTTVDGVLRQSFPDVVDVDFTADLEKRLDGIEEGVRGYEPTVRAWYEGFQVELARAEKDMERVKVPARATGEECPECHEGELVVRESRYGEFTGCSRYPECSYIKKDPAAEPQPTGESCPDCSRPLVVRRSKRGPFTGCSGYPDCRYIKQEGPPRAGRGGAAGAAAPRATQQQAGRDCPDCKKPLLVRAGRRGPFIGCSGYPRCRHTENEVTAATAPAADLSAFDAPPPAADGTAAPVAEPAALTELGPCPDCGKALVERRGRFGPFVSCSGYPGCKYRPPKGARVPAAAEAATPS